MVEDWDEDEIAKDPRTYLSEETSADAMYHMLKQYHKHKGIKLNPAKVSNDPNIFVEAFIMDTIKFDKEFHKFVLENYGIRLRYDKENDKWIIDT